MEFDERLHLVLSAAMKAELEQVARANGETVSEYVRRELAQALDRARVVEAKH